MAPSQHDRKIVDRDVKKIKKIKYEYIQETKSLVTSVHKNPPSIHSTDRPYGCADCNKKYKSKDILGTYKHKCLAHHANMSV